MWVHLVGTEGDVYHWSVVHLYDGQMYQIELFAAYRSKPLSAPEWEVVGMPRVTGVFEPIHGVLTASSVPFPSQASYRAEQQKERNLGNLIYDIFDGWHEQQLWEQEQKRVT